MNGNDDFLREKAKLLIARERELLALKRRHKRLGLWLALAERLAELVDPKLELHEICCRVSDHMVSALDLHTVAFFGLHGTSLRRIGDTADGQPIELEPAILAILSGGTGVCLETGGAAQRDLSEAVGLSRFLWHRMVPVEGPALLFVAGYDRDRTAFYAPFGEDDLAHFSNSAHQLELLLANSNLVRQLERDKRLLHEFNVGLEARVEERTRELAATNRALEEAFERLRQREQRLKEDIDEARLFQQSVLTRPPASREVDFSAWYQPLEPVGGDLFDVWEAEPGKWRIFLADATGHGVQASMRTILIKAEYDRLKAAHPSPRTLLETLNSRLITLFPRGETMCTGCCLDVACDNLGGATVAYANAGNAPILHWSAGCVRAIYLDAPFLGVAALDWPEPLTFRISPGDVLVVASDGLTEQRNEQGDSFEDAVQSSGVEGSGSSAEFVDRLLRRFEAFRGKAALGDDLTLVAVRLPARPQGGATVITSGAEREIEPKLR